jgi:hypothetical protein
VQGEPRDVADVEPLAPASDARAVEAAMAHAHEAAADAAERLIRRWSARA